MHLRDLLTIVIGAAAGSGATFVFSRAIGAPLMALARARARRVKHVPVSGALLYANGVPLDEAQFREAFAAMHAELDELPPSAERNRWELDRQAHAINRFLVLAGTYPEAFIVRLNADDAWAWYRENGPYAVSDDPQLVQAVFEPPGRIAFIRRPHPEPPPLD